MHTGARVIVQQGRGYTQHSPYPSIPHTQTRHCATLILMSPIRQKSNSKESRELCLPTNPHVVIGHQK